MAGDTGWRCAKVPALVGSLDLLRDQAAKRERHFAGADYNDSFADPCDC